MYHKEKNCTKKKMSKTCFCGAINTYVFSCFGRFYFHFCYLLKISTDYEYKFECDLLKSKTRTAVSLTVSNFKGCCNIEITFIQIKWKWCYRLSDIGFFPIFVPIGVFPSIPPGGAKASLGKGQGVLLGQNPPPLYPPLKTSCYKESLSRSVTEPL